MPGYGIAAADQGNGLLPWSWAAERLTRAQNYWVSSIRPNSGSPHAMPVWGMWDDSELWFTSGVQSRKARNLMADPRCVVTTEDAVNPVIIEGAARVVTDPVSLRRVIDLMAGEPMPPSKLPVGVLSCVRHSTVPAATDLGRVMVVAFTAYTNPLLEPA